MKHARHAAAAALIAVVGGGALCALVLGGESPADAPAPIAGAASAAQRSAPRAELTANVAAGAQDEAPAVPTRIDLVPGEVRELTFTYEGRLSIGSAGSEAEALATRAAGRLVVTCYHAGDEVLLGQRWTADTLQLDGQDGVSREALLRDLGVEVLVRLDRQGRLLGLALPARASAEARNLVRALVASASVVLPAAPAARWTAPGFDPIGACEDTYACSAVDASGALVRRARRITGAHGADGAALDVAHEGDVDLTIARDGLASRVAGRELVSVRSSDAGVSMSLRTTTALERTGARALSRDEAAAALAAVEAGLGAWSWTVGLAPEVGGAGAHVARVEPRDLETLLAAIALAFPEDADDVSADAPRLFLELAERFRRDPEAIARALELVRGTRLGSGARATVIDALGEAGTPDAQLALIAIAGDAAVLDDVVPNVFLSLAEPDAPLPETVATLQRFSASDDPLRAEWATQGLGILGNRVEPALGDRLAAGIEQGLGKDAGVDRVLLEALGNAARPRSAGAIVAYTTSTDEELRATAVSALRQLESDSVDAALARALKDESHVVRREALRSYAARGAAAALAPVTAALESDPEAIVRVAALEVLLRWIEETPADQAASAQPLRALVERAAASNGSAEVREVAGQALGGA